MTKILINALQFSPDGAGISKYSYKLAEVMMKNNKNVDVLCRKDMVEKFENKERLIPIDVSRSSNRIIKEQVKLLKLYKNYDIVHFLDYATPALYKGKKIATIHDMAMHTMKDKYTKRQVLIKTILLKNTIKNADKLICISEFTKKELLRYYPDVDERKIEVAYNGFEYNEISLNEEEEKKILNKFNINKEYLLFVGTLSPHKNIERLVEAFNQIKKQGYDYQLVICGKKGWLYEDIFKKVKQLGLEREVIFTGYVTDEELETLYKNTKLFVFPSLYEGFGFPPIEAMARNVPVLASREGALPEVVGDAAIFCDAYNTISITENIIKIIQNESLMRKLVGKSKERSNYFSWNKAQYKMCDIYSKILNDK
ncbi:glycosyltransferase family 4 protein [Romboutsia lituseburensis]|uniref:glycosyltransferase family 4 protein n=1 Tax=Romboutsia lituseburensis TaxID=1537 RepID=UPI0022EB56C2|nr:glycosyltransferase family 1 protein [Romboutsia lituseburensis]